MYKKCLTKTTNFIKNKYNNNIKNKLKTKRKIYIMNTIQFQSDKNFPKTEYEGEIEF